MVIRTLRTTDLLRVFLDGPSMGPDWAQTWERVGGKARNTFSPTAMAKGLVLKRERELSSVLAEGLHLRALASVRARSGFRAWEVRCLSLSPEMKQEGIELLERLCMLVGDEGGERVFLRLPAQSHVGGLAKQAGFLPCAQETLYRREASPSHIPFTGKFIRPFLPADGYPIFRLYNECVPSKVKTTYAVTFDEWNDALEPSGENVQQGIYEAQGCLRGWVRVGSGKSGPNRVEMMVHPEEEAYAWEDMLSWGLQHGKPMAPFLALVADHQPTLAWVLEKKGFMPTGKYNLMVKSIALRVKDSSLVTAGA